MEKQIFVQSRQPLLAMHYSPECPCSGKCSVLILHPFAEEKKSSHRVMVSVAQALRNEGHHVMMFDMGGCGDSWRQKDYPVSDLEYWIADIVTARDELVRISGARQNLLLGLRFGAYLGRLARMLHFPEDRMMGLAPVDSPSEYLRKSLRQKLIKELMTDGKVSSSRESLLNDLENDRSIDFDGYRISASFYRSVMRFERMHPFDSLAGKNDTVIRISPTDRRSSGILSSEVSLKMPDFWNKHSDTDPDPLIRAVLKNLRI